MLTRSLSVFRIQHWLLLPPRRKLKTKNPALVGTLEWMRVKNFENGVAQEVCARTYSCAHDRNSFGRMSRECERRSVTVRPCDTGIYKWRYVDWEKRTAQESKLVISEQWNPQLRAGDSNARPYKAIKLRARVRIDRIDRAFRSVERGRRVASHKRRISQ